MLLDGKVALITGAGSGIGKAAAQLLAKNGAKIAALEIDQDEANSVTKELKQQGCEALALVADISNPEQVKRAIQQVVDKWQTIHIVFANAGINGVWAPIDELEPQDWDKTINTNLKGTFLTVKYAVPYLKKQGGSIIITSSINGTRVFSNTGATAYATTKAAQVAFGKMMALELAKHHIRVNVICPGAVSTNIEESTKKSPHLDQAREPAIYPEGDIPLTDGTPGKPEDIAKLVLFLASDESRYISGTEVWIDGAGSLIRG